jgi:hypothetical protein
MWLLQSLTTNAAALATQDAALAAQLVRDLPDGKMRGAMIQGAVEGVALKDLTAAIELANLLEGDEARTARIAAVRAFVTNTGADGARTALEAAVDDPAMRSGIVMQAVAGSSAIGFHDQAAFIDEFMRDDPLLIHAADRVAAEWAHDDPPAAIAWMEQYHDRDGFDGCIDSVTIAWMQHDLESASAWLGTLESGAARDAGVAQLIEHVMDIDPISAVEWSATISNPEVRVRFLNESAQAVQRYANAPNALKDLIESLPLSDDERAAVVEKSRQ